MAIPNNQKKPLILLLSGSGLFALSLLSGFPGVIFISFVPFLILLDLPWNLKQIYLAFFLSVSCVFCLTFIPGPWGITGVFYYAFGLSALFTSYFIAQRFTQNRLNKFSLVILWLGFEYVLLTFLMHKNPFFLADLFQDHSTWIRWNMYTGYMGPTLWILLVNLLIYEAVNGLRINYFLLVLAAMSTILPIIYSINLSQNALTKGDVIAFYSGNRTANSYYGELISRTGAWVSILIIIFTLIRVKTKKVAR